MSVPEPRGVALDVLLRVERGGASDRTLDRRLRRARLAPRDRGLATELVYGVLRRQGSIDAALRPCSRQSLPDLEPAVRTALRLGAYQVLFLDRVPPHAAVSATVDAVKAHSRGGAGYVNGVLRGLLRAGHATAPADALVDTPQWWVERWIERYGEADASAWFEGTMLPSPMAVRAHPKVLSEKQMVEELGAEGVELEASPFVAGAWRVVAGNPMDSALLRDGKLALRGEASQLVASLLPVSPGDRVLDACAGRGGKALQIAADASPAMLVANDITGWRAAACRQEARAAGVTQVRATVADLSAGAPFAAGFDAVLVDAPCSGLGTVRRRPELKWRTDVERLERLAELQAGILTNAAATLVPGGTLLYATCSTEPEENEQVVARVLAERADLELCPVVVPGDAAADLVGADGYFRTYPQHPAVDGFFAARMTRVR